MIGPGAISAVLRQTSTENDLPGTHPCAHKEEEEAVYNFLSKTQSRVQCSYRIQCVALSPPCFQPEEANSIALW